MLGGIFIDSTAGVFLWAHEPSGKSGAVQEARGKEGWDAGVEPSCYVVTKIAPQCEVKVVCGSSIC